MSGKPLFHGVERGRVLGHADSQQFRNHIHRAIVLGRTKSTGGHDHGHLAG